jgi:hypothetical protein
MRTTHRAEIFGFALALSLFLLPSPGAGVRAQSSDVAWPSPVRAREVSGTIPARDIGDARLTDHFYAFTGTPGDVLITVDSQNLNGDIDVFTFAGMRPLLKFTVYAGSSAQIQKSIYLRQREDLVLRIEGRTPNDDEASYRIQFSGSFEPITSGPLAEHDDATRSGAASELASRSGHRVTSAGARIDEPRTEVAVAPTPEPTPAEVKKAEAKPPTTSRRNTTTIRRLPPGNRRTRPAPKPKPEVTAKAPAEEQPATSGETETASTNRTTPPKRSTSTRRNRPAPAVAAEPSTAEPAAVEQTGPRLIIETSYGTLVDRFMTTVRRVTVENGQVVVIGKDGKIQRIPLASVVRMTIAP